MIPSEPKYEGEIALHLFSATPAQFRPYRLDAFDLWNAMAKEVVQSATIYFVTKRPRMRVLDDSLNIAGRDWIAEIELSTTDGPRRERVRLPGMKERLPQVASLQINQQHQSHIELLDEHDANQGNIPIEVFLHGGPFSSYAQAHEVLYIGQAYRKHRRVGILDRIKNHSTLQAILADTLTNDPFNEVFITCFAFDPPNYIIHFDGRSKAEIRGEADHLRLMHAYANPPTEPQCVAIAEACLIRYFRPPYNLLLKESFPSTNLTILNACYELDFNAIVTEINAEQIDCTFHTECVAPSHLHFAMYDLHAREERRSFFYLTDEEFRNSVGGVTTSKRRRSQSRRSRAR